MKVFAFFFGLGASTGFGLGGDGCGGGGCEGLEDCGGEGGCGEEGCGGEEGCDIEAQMAEAGCSGEASEQPGDTGCVGCRILAHHNTTGKWTIRITHDGVEAHVRRGFRPGPLQLVLALLPVLFLHRRRRSRGEF